jgi:hypothetical protein
VAGGAAGGVGRPKCGLDPVRPAEHEESDHADEHDDHGRLVQSRIASAGD